MPERTGGSTAPGRDGLLARLWRHPGLRRLVGVRFCAQFAEGTSQAALAGIVLFSPEDAADPLGVAAGFAVLLLPYSVLGPFAAAALDRWDRRRVLAWSCAVRVLCLALIAVGLLLGWAGSGPGLTALLTLALLQAGTHRFLNSGVAAALPHRAPREVLVGLNAALATVGSVIAASGALVAFLVLALTPARSEAVVAASSTGIAALACVAAAVLVLGHPRGDLGPFADETPPAALADTRPASVVRDLASGLAEGAVTAWRAPGVRAPLIGVAAHRAVLGVNTLVLVLLLRQDPAGGSGERGGVLGFGLVIGAMALGMALAAVATPLLMPRLGRRTLCTVSLVCLAVVQVALVPQVGPDSPVWLLALAGTMLGLPSQVVKLSADAGMLLDVPSHRRGRVFAVQDMVFNAVFVVALTLAVPWVEAGAPDRALLLGVAVIYAAAALAVHLTRGVPGPGAPVGVSPPAR